MSLGHVNARDGHIKIFMDQWARGVSTRNLPVYLGLLRAIRDPKTTVANNHSLRFCRGFIARAYVRLCRIADRTIPTILWLSHGDLHSPVLRSAGKESLFPGRNGWDAHIVQSGGASRRNQLIRPLVSSTAARKWFATARSE